MRVQIRPVEIAITSASSFLGNPSGIFAAILLMVFLLGSVTSAADSNAIAWPRVIESNGKKLTVYQPQVDAWKDYGTLHFRCAIAVEGVLKEEHFGVAECDAETVVDHETRLVAVRPKNRDLRFAKVSDADAAALRTAVNELSPMSNVTIMPLDQVLAYLDASKQRVQPKVAISLDPPKIFHSESPAVLVNFIGKPKFKPVDSGNGGLLFAINTNWDVFFEPGSGRYYLLNGEGWLTTNNPLEGPWSATAELPASISNLPDTPNWEETRKHIPGTPAGVAPKVFASAEPAELILTDGEPAFAPIAGTGLARVANTSSLLFRDVSNSTFYLLVAGRWFSATTLDGPWAAASKSLPADFSKIPDSDPMAFVKASVPGTRDAQDAVLLASVPSSTTVKLDEKPVEVTYNGAPKFKPIDGTQVQCAINSPKSVLLVGGAYYCCDQGAWFTSGSPNGPWGFATSVPPAIYAIPPSSAVYNVTYVTVQSATPTTVTYNQTAGYSGEYVASTGVLMFGAGMLVGAAMADDDDHYCYPPYPAYYSYGSGAAYHYGYGGYYAGGAACYGPYGGAGYATAYNPATGTYARSNYAYGPYGSAESHAAYNPYTGAGAWSQQANSAYGSAARGAAYDPRTGATAAGRQVSTAYGSAGRAAAYNPTTGNYARGGYTTGQYGTAAAVKTGEGSGAAGWNTANRQGAVAKTQSGDVYASNGDSVYRRDSGGGWQSNSGDGWQNVEKGSVQSERASSAQQPRSSYQSGTQRESMESEARSRERGNDLSDRSGAYRSAGGFSHSDRSFGGGGRGRR